MAGKTIDIGKKHVQIKLVLMSKRAYKQKESMSTILLFSTLCNSAERKFQIIQKLTLLFLPLAVYFISKTTKRTSKSTDDR